MENRYNFAFAAAGVRIDRLDSVKTAKARLKLTVTEGGPVYLFRGRYENAAACEAALQPPEPTFVLGASGTSDTEMSLESDMGVVTIYNRGAGLAVGFVQLVDVC